MQMAHLRCKTPEMVEKEIWMHCLAYNLIHQVMGETARAHQLQPRQFSFKGAVQTMNSFAPHLDPALPQLERQHRWNQLLRVIASHRVGNRPNRIEPRKLKYRVGKFTYMTRPRSEERKRLSG